MGSALVIVMMGLAPPGNSIYEPLEAVLVRAPLLPVECFAGTPSSHPRAEWEVPAIAVGSLSLAREGVDQDAGGAGLRYRLRMSARPTPYGLFAGVALARWGERTTLTLADASLLTQSRPDMGILLRMIMRLEQRRELRQRLRLRANSAALMRGGRVILAERPVIDGDGAVPQRVSVRATAPTRALMSLARNPIRFDDLADELARMAPAISRSRIEQLIHELVDQGLLLTELRPPLTSVCAAEWLYERLSQCQDDSEVSDHLAKLISGARRFDRLPAQQRKRAYVELASSAQRLDDRAAAPLQVDMIYPLAGDQLHRGIGSEVARAASLMLRLSPFPTGFPYLRAYADAFASRYGEGRETPLLELLDPHWGLGPPDPNANGVWVDRPERDRTLLELACRAIADRLTSIELDDALVAKLDTSEGDTTRWPRSLDVCAFVCGAPGRIDEDFRVVVGPNVGALAAGRNLARFATHLGADGRAAFAAAYEAETCDEHESTAEICYLPHTFRLANVALRPAAGRWEIAVGISPGGEEVPLDELLVGQEQGRLYLRWPGKAERLVVTSSHMLNFVEAPAVCRFLAHMHADAKTQLHVFDWGPAARFPFLPRVETGRVVLRLAEWRLAPEPAATDQVRAFTAWLERERERWTIPRFVYSGAGDVRLLLDLNDAAHVDELRRAYRKSGGSGVLLQEALPSLEDAWLKGPGGHYLTEIVVSLARAPTEDSVPPPGRIAGSLGSSDLQRLFTPGEEWLSLKLYGSPEQEDDLLAGPIGQLFSELTRSGAIRKAYFLRYSDPDPHLRLRLEACNLDAVRNLMTETGVWARELIDNDLCTRFAFDSYEREIERYGGAEVVEAIEDVFAADSVLVLALLNLARDRLIEHRSLCAWSALDLLDAFEPQEALGSQLAERLRDYWREAGSLYRTSKAALIPLVSDASVLLGRTGAEEVLVALSSRCSAARCVSDRLEAARINGSLTSPLINVVLSLLHMHCNRFLGRDRKAEREALGLMLRLKNGRRAWKASHG